MSRPRRNDSWFVFHDSSWSFHEPYLAENTYFTNRLEWTQHKIMIFKPVSKYQIIRHLHNFKNILSTISTIIHFFIKQTFSKHHFTRSRNNKPKRRDNDLFKHLLFNLLWCLEKQFVKLCSTRNFNLSCSIEMYHFEKLS